MALPLSIYGNSKLAGELLVRTMARKYFVIRTCGLYGRAGSRGKGGNFVETMLSKARNGDSIRVVNDQTITPTSTLEVARQMATLLPTDALWSVSHDQRRLVLLVRVCIGNI